MSWPPLTPLSDSELLSLKLPLLVRIAYSCNFLIYGELLSCFVITEVQSASVMMKHRRLGGSAICSHSAGGGKAKIKPWRVCFLVSLSPRPADGCLPGSLCGSIPGISSSSYKSCWIKVPPLQPRPFSTSLNAPVSKNSHTVGWGHRGHSRFMTFKTQKGLRWPFGFLRLYRFKVS